MKTTRRRLLSWMPALPVLLRTGGYRERMLAQMEQLEQMAAGATGELAARLLSARNAIWRRLEGL